MSGLKLTLARQFRFFTQTELANEVGVTPRAISKYEKTGYGLSDSTLITVASVLDLDPSFFIDSEIDIPKEAALSFRARSKMSAKNRNKAIAASAFGLILSDWMEDNYTLPPTSVPDLSGYDAEDAARVLRSLWGLGEGPILNIISLLESHGIRVFSVTEISQTIDAYSFWDEERARPFVFLTTAKSGERRRMDAAHELGHLVLHRKVPLDDNDTREIEKEANTFASAFLMPAKGFCSSINRPITFSEIMHVKKYWKVSAFAAAFRAHSLNLLSDWQYHNLCVNLGKRGMRTQEQDSIIPERSQIADKILNQLREANGNISEIIQGTGLSRSIVMSLTFNPVLRLVPEEVL